MSKTLTFWTKPRGAFATARCAHQELWILHPGKKNGGSLRVRAALSWHIVCQMGQHRACWRGRQGHILPPLALCKIYFWDVQFRPVWVLPSACQTVNRLSSSRVWLEKNRDREKKPKQKTSRWDSKHVFLIVAPSQSNGLVGFIAAYVQG